MKYFIGIIDQSYMFLKILFQGIDVWMLGCIVFIVGGLAQYIYLAYRLHYREDMKSSNAAKVDRYFGIAYFSLFSIFVFVYIAVYTLH